MIGLNNTTVTGIILQIEFHGLDGKKSFAGCLISCFITSQSFFDNQISKSTLTTSLWEVILLCLTYRLVLLYPLIFRMRKEMVAKVNCVAAEFRKVSDLQMADTTKRTIQENVAINQQLSRMSDKVIAQVQ